MDKQDFETIKQIAKEKNKTFIEALLDVLEVRVSSEEIQFVSSALIESSSLFTPQKMERSFKNYIKGLNMWSKKLLPYQHYITYGIVFVCALFLVYRLIQSFITSNEARFVQTKNGIVIDFTIEDVQKDIAMFKRIDPASDEKIKKYQEIVHELDLLTENKRRVNDVAELRAILEKEYYQ